VDPPSLLPPELDGYLFTPGQASGAASDHRPVIADFILPPAEDCCSCPGDLSDPCDDIVNVTDFTIFAAAFGSSQGDPNWNECADLSSPPDGIINVTDFTVFAAQFGQSCP
jgi:hypothetical protein